MKFLKMRNNEKSKIFQIPDPQANSLREFAIKMIRMINSDPKWEFPKKIPILKWNYFSTRVQCILIHWTLVDFQEKFL